MTVEISHHGEKVILYFMVSLMINMTVDLCGIWVLILVCGGALIVDSERLGYLGSVLRITLSFWTSRDPSNLTTMSKRPKLSGAQGRKNRKEEEEKHDKDRGTNDQGSKLTPANPPNAG